MTAHKQLIYHQAQKRYLFLLLFLFLLMDSLHITGIRAYGYSGLLPQEQTLGQWFEVNLTLWLDTSQAGKSDRIEDTHNYCTDVETIQTLIRTARFQLIEKLAETIAQTVLTAKEIEQVRVQLTKLTPPIPDFSGQVTIDITRSANHH